MLAALVVLAPAAVSAQIFETIGIRAQGMSGAFVAVADDATTTWWNPAGLASGGHLNMVLEIDRIEDSSLTRARAFSLTVPSLGLSYYRLSLSGMQALSTTASGATSLEDQGVLSQYGATVGQSVGAHLVVATTQKLVRAMDQTKYDLDAGAMAMFGPVRVGLALKNLRTPEFSQGDEGLELRLQARTGVSYRVGSAGRAEVTTAADADLTTTPTAVGDERRVAAGVEAWLGSRVVGFRAGVGVNIIGENRQRSGSVGVSLALQDGLYADAQLTRGSDEARNGWGFALRVTL